LDGQPIEMSSKWQINHCPYSNHMYHYGSRSNKKAIKYPGNPVHPGNPVQGGNALFSNKAKIYLQCLRVIRRLRAKLISIYSFHHFPS